MALPACFSRRSPPERASRNLSGGAAYLQRGFCDLCDTCADISEKPLPFSGTPAHGAHSPRTAASIPRQAQVQRAERIFPPPQVPARILLVGQEQTALAHERRAQLRENPQLRNGAGNAYVKAFRRCPRASSSARAHSTSIPIPAALLPRSINAHFFRRIPPPSRGYPPA